MEPEDSLFVKRCVDLVLTACIAPLMVLWWRATPTPSTARVRRVRKRVPCAAKRERTIHTGEPQRASSSPLQRPWREEETSTVPWTRVQRRTSSTC